MPEDNAANQKPEDGVQGNQADQNAQDGAGQQEGNQDADAGQQQASESEGLKAAAVAERKKRQEIEELYKLEQQRAQMAQEELLRLQQGQIQQTRDPNDLITYGEMQQRQAELYQSIQFQNLKSQLTDMDDILGIGVGTQMYQPSEQVKQMVRDNPSLIGIDRFIRDGNAQAVTMAYREIKQRKELEELRAFKQAAEEQTKLKGVENQLNPTSPAAAGGGGGLNLNAQIPPSDSPDFDALWAKIKRGDFDQVRS